MSKETANTFLILKYGSVSEAYFAWKQMAYSQEGVFTREQRDVLRDHEDSIYRRISAAVNNG